MLRRKSSALFVLLSVVAGFTMPIGNVAHAQTGPVKANASPAPGAGPEVPAQKLSPEAMTKYLRDKGHKVKQGRGPDGRMILYVHVERNDWKFDIEFEYSPDQASFFAICPLGKAETPYSAPQLTAILKGNYELSPCRFVIRSGDGRLCLESSWNSIMTTDYFQGVLEQLTNNVQRTHNLWDESRWTNPMTPMSTVAGTSVP